METRKKGPKKSRCAVRRPKWPFWQFGLLSRSAPLSFSRSSLRLRAAPCTCASRAQSCLLPACRRALQTAAVRRSAKPPRSGIRTRRKKRSKRGPLAQPPRSRRGHIERSTRGVNTLEARCALPRIQIHHAPRARTHRWCDVSSR